ncbi:hypothetical protein PsorP6_001872 [Peronosclerospora sorghi]|uniref:Uncharacterized protein n=1 Tax=Peronosclerospora sorghi TaxID=230839 RepID=A0ACC0WUP0_9STRA|nr:hypothetical protein PsorP6_001872 [Peronosclerospora sorghi]
MLLKLDPICLGWAVRDLSQPIMVDNTPRACELHDRMCVFFSRTTKNDREIESVSCFRFKIHEVEDVRDYRAHVGGTKR